MKTLVIYTSETGYTKQYVDMLERRLIDPKIVELKELKKDMIKEADFIFYGGPLKNNVIRGLDKFLKHSKLFEGKDVFIFCTGIQPNDDEKKELVIMANALDSYHVRLYMLPGGLDLTKMGTIKRKLMEMGFKRAFESGQVPEGVSMEMLEERFKYPISLIDPNAIDRMCHVYTVLVSRKNAEENN